MADLTQERLKELVHYDPATGIFTRRVALSTRSKVGEVLARTNQKGYVSFRIDNTLYLAHRLAFLYMQGVMPPLVDHINRIRTDNRWANLRAASRRLNAINARPRKDNSTGTPNVHYHKASGKWQAVIQDGGRQHYLGLFDSRDDAAEAASKAKAAHHNPFASEKVNVAA